MRRRASFGILAAALVCGLLLVRACGPTHGEQVAQRIEDARAGWIAKVVYVPRNRLDREEVDVYMSPGAKEREAEALWCHVVVPADGEDVVVIFDAGGQEMSAASSVSCR
jgi:hypothetical protein